MFGSLLVLTWIMASVEGKLVVDINLDVPINGAVKITGEGKIDPKRSPNGSI